ncbi:aromatase/cyclase [Streptomyces polygonati]|uniref:Aromatase/cyclase n=1 Tax=Streptomyces polygonati TaxID=1617087 RepID=A0ABV8HN89_9ACTN
MTTTAESRAADHIAVLNAPGDRAYRLIADVTRWPLMFSPCLAATVLEGGPGRQRIRLWALVGSEVRSWTSERTLDPAAGLITFRQEKPSPPIARMRGHWRFEDTGGGCRLVLHHEWATEGNDPRAGAFVGEALDRNSEAEIGAVTSWAERAQDQDELIFSFSDRVLIDGAPADVYDFLYAAGRWPARLPHVSRLDLETAPASDATAGAEVQIMEMDTAAADGSTHTTRSVRLCFRDERIVYKQTTTPRGLLAHGGEWRLKSVAEGVQVTARHHIALDPDVISEVFGAGVGVAGARDRVRQLIGGNSLRTLRTVKAAVEGAERAGAET